MRVWEGEISELVKDLRGAFTQFGFEMAPFVEELTAGFGDAAVEGAARDFPCIEVVLARFGLARDGGKKRGDRGARIRLFLKPEELGVMAVTLGTTGEDFLGEQSFAPGGDEALGVEIAGMEGPEAQDLQKRQCMFERLIGLAHIHYLAQDRVDL